MAVIIMTLYKYPVLQVLLTLLLNFWYMVFIATYRPFNSRKAIIIEIINEIVTLVTIYLLCLFTGDVIKDSNTREMIGLVVILLTIFNFLGSTIVSCFEIYHVIRQRYLMRQTEKKIKSMKLKAVRVAEAKRRKIRRPRLVESQQQAPLSP